MNVLLVIAMLALGIVSEAERLDKAFLICDWQEKWLPRKSNMDNKTDKKSKDGLPTATTPNKEITRIYEYNEKLEFLVNMQIRLELYAFYNYLSMSRFFQKYDEDREGFAKYFRSAASEELEHAEAFMKYQQMRGGNVNMYNLPAPVQKDWRHGKDVLITAFALEKNVTDEILCLHNIAVNKFHDTDFVNFLEEKIIPEQYESMKEIKTHIKTLDRACPGKLATQCDSYPLYELRYDAMLKGEK